MNLRQQPMRLRIKKQIKKLDIFGQTVALSFRQDEQYKTFVGGIASILVLATIVSFFYSNIIGFFMMDEVTSATAMIFEDDPGLIELNSDTFMFAVQIEHENFVDFPYFNISVEQRHYQNVNGTLIKQPNEQIELEICTQEHFNKIFATYNYNNEQQQKDLNITNFLCPNLKQSNQWRVGGVYTSSDYYFLKFSVVTCVNDTNENSNWKPNCRTKEEMYDHLKSVGSFRFQLYTTNFIVNPETPRDYITPYLAIEQFYTFVPKQMFVQSDIFIREKRITTDKGILMYPVEVKEIIAYREHMDSRQQFEIGASYEDYFAAFYLQRSNFSYNIKRSFVTLDQLLSQLGGFSEFMIAILGIFISLYNKQSLLVDLANDLYEFNFNQQQENTRAFISQLLSSTKHGREVLHQRTKEKIIQSMNPFQNKPPMDQKIQITSPQQSSKQFMQISSTRQFKTITEKSSEYFEKFKSLMKNQMKINLGFRIILGDLLPFECLQNQESLLFRKAMDSVGKELDIKYIINQLHEINKLKKVMFSRDQFELFSFSHKPTISLGREKRNRLSSKYYYYGQEDEVNQELQKQFESLIKAYQKISSINIKTSDDQLQLNQRIIGLLGRELPIWIERELQQEYSESVKEPEPDDNDEFSKV